MELESRHLEPIEYTGQICVICEEEATHCSKCGLVICQDCITAYLDLKISEGNVINIPCPHHVCDLLITEDEVLANVSEASQAKFTKFSTRIQLKQNAYLKFCPRPDCEGHDIALNKSHLTCSLCSYNYCAYCSEAWHGNSKCSEENDAKLDMWARSNNVKYCPKCHIRIEKEQGCPHMTCTNCSYEFCWHCGQNYEGHKCQLEAQRLRDIQYLYALAYLFAPLVMLLYFPVVVFKIFKKCIDLSARSRSYRAAQYVLVAGPPTLFVVGIAPAIILVACIGTGISRTYAFINNKFGRRSKDVVRFLSLFAFIPGVMMGVVLLFCLLGAVAVLPVFGLMKLVYELVVLACRNRRENHTQVLIGFT
jgi:branched-subunit amino acid transport protein AzlD